MNCILICSIFAALCAGPSPVRAEDKTLDELLALERGAMDGLLKGDPDKLISTLDPEITYLHVMTTKRLEGLAAVTALCERYRGRPLFDSYEIAAPLLQVVGEAAVLTYQLSTRNGNATSLWNATQIYRRTPRGWRAIHTHWSQVQPAGPPG